MIHRYSGPPHVLAAMGPGSPLEVVVEDVLGVPCEVFAHRPRSMGDVLARTADSTPDQEYLVFPEQTVSFADVRASAARVAARLSEEYGVSHGDRVGFAAANSLPWAVGWWAVASVGAVISGLNGWWTGAELAYGVELTEPKLIFADGPRRERLAELGIASVDIDSLRELIGPPRSDDPAFAAAPVDEDDPLIIMFTSGTTGRPKGATISHRNLIHSCLASAIIGVSAMNLGAPTTAPVRPAQMLVSPLFHVSGSLPLAASGMFGSKLVAPPPGRWDEVTHLQLTETHRVSGWAAVPTQFWRLLEHPRFDEFDTSSVTSLAGGGSVFAPELYRLMQRKMPQASIGTGYGTTETGGFGTRLAGVTLETDPASVGTVNATFEVEVRDADGNPVEDGTVGEIHIRGASVFLGYWNDPHATAAALDAQRWYATGDFGSFDHGVLFLASRMRDMIIRGGENIYPIEIENRLMEHPSIAEACVVGVEHRQLGHEVVAAVVLHPGASLEVSTIQAFVGETLAPFKVPSRVVVLDQLPYTATGKIIKRDVEAIVAGLAP